MDPLSVSASAASLITICVQAIRLIKQTIETVKGANGFLQKLLDQTERMRLCLEQLRSLTHQLGGQTTLLLNFSDRACMATINELEVLVANIGTKTKWIGFQILLHQNTSKNLLTRLRHHEKEICTVLLFILTLAVLRTQDEVPREAIPQVEGVKPGKRQLWLGDTLRSHFEASYLSHRDALSDAAYFGQWRKLFAILESSERTYSQSWVNCTRIKEDPSQGSGWTPLHQAVYMRASEHEVRELLRLGALRTLRTTRTDPDTFSHADMTAVEMARELNYWHLYDILSPVIRHNLPPLTLHCLQQRFYDIIRRNLGLQTKAEHLRLPQLIALTELEVPEMWFPLSSPDSMTLKGYIYRLESRELRVKGYGLHGPGHSKVYQISEESVQEI